MTGANFEELVGDALDSLPADILEMLSNVQVVVEEEPPAERSQQIGAGHTLLGLYEGIPLTERSQYSGALPDKITIFKGPITRMSSSASEITEQVRRTVIHELAHHFGIDDRRLEELGWA